MVKGSEAAVRSDSVAVDFDDERLVANAGLLLGTLSGAWGSSAWSMRRSILASEQAPRARAQGALAIHAISARRPLDRRRRRPSRRGHRDASGPPGDGALDARDLPARVYFGHVRQLDRVLDESLSRAWGAGAGPGRSAW